MRKLDRILLSAVALGAVACAGSAMAAPDGVKIGVLTCHVDSGWGLILGSSKDMECQFSPNHGMPDRYVGSMSKLGVDIGYTRSAEIVWDVIAPTSDVGPGALQGEYAGATASATVVAGVGAHVLLGGFDKSIALQPVSVEGNSGLDVAAGIGAMHLKAAEPQRAAAEVPPPPPPPAAPPRTFAVFFGFNKDNLTPESRDVIAHAVRFAEDMGAARIRVIGHADTVGSNSYNDRLSMRRADVVRAEMIRDGIRPSLIMADARGFHDPVIPTGPGVRERQNRGAFIILSNMSVSYLERR